MTLVLGIAVVVAVLVGVILFMPCPACQRRRERLHAAYEEWRRSQNGTGR